MLTNIKQLYQSKTQERIEFLNTIECTVSAMGQLSAPVRQYPFKCWDNNNSQSEDAAKKSNF